MKIAIIAAARTGARRVAASVERSELAMARSVGGDARRRASGSAAGYLAV
jgi:hypothetical protein